MTSRKSKLQLAFSALTLLVLLAPLASPWAFLQTEPVAAAPLPIERDASRDVESLDTWSGLFRTHVTLRQPKDLSRIESMGAVVLESGEDWALLLVTSSQLETLARLGYQPQATNSLDSLTQSKVAPPWLQTSLQPLLAQASSVQELALKAKSLEADQSELQAESVTETLAEAQADLRTALHALAPEQQAGIQALGSIDDDGDGLTNIEELWWCTDPMDTDSDDDLVDDGIEVNQLLSSDTTNGKPFIGWPPDHVGCFDDDDDSIPDAAETNIIGLNINRESTDGDKFDDGQEFFGITKYPDYGSLPRFIDSFSTPNMPGWVDPPGNSPFVAAYPQIHISVIPNSIQVELVTEITAGESHSVGETVAYGTAHTEGSGTGVGKEQSHTYNEWQEVGNSVADAVERSTYQSIMQSQSQQYTWEHSIGRTREVEKGRHWDLSLGVHGSVGVETGATFRQDLSLQDLGIGLDYGGSSTVEVGGSIEGTYGESWADRRSTSQQTTQGGSIGYEVTRESGESFTVSQVHESSHAIGVGYESTQATTITREDYEEFSVTNENAFATEQEWSTATAVDTSHAADLTFEYRVNNSGSDSARQISDILFSIAIGNIKMTTYAGNLLGESCSQTVINDLYPGDVWPEAENAVQCAVPLSLEAVRAIDLGAPIRIVVADYSYGDDENFYENAWGGGVIVEVDDGTRDGDEGIDNYLIPTWGAETYQDILKRYFPVTETEDGDILSIFTPEYDANHEISAWYEHKISGNSWWNVYLSEYGNGYVVPFREREAMPETRILMRFNQDTDGDHFSDRVERKYATDLYDAMQHPNAGLTAGFYEKRIGNTVEVQLAMQNVGSYDAYGVQATMYELDDSISVGADLVGLAGLIPSGNKVALTSRIDSPQPISWGGYAQPVTSGHYTGTVDKTYTFTVTNVVTDTGFVGKTTGLSLNWSDGINETGNINIGTGYTSPSLIPLNDGVKIGMGSGTVLEGDQFAVQALIPRDVFTYTINEEPYTPPMIVISYNDPEGNHRFVTPVSLDHVTDDLVPYIGSEELAPEMIVFTEDRFDPTADNSVFVSFINPQAKPIENGFVMVAYATYTGTVVASELITTTFLPGPNNFEFSWSTDVFSPTFETDTSYKIRVYAMDSDTRPFDIQTVHFFEMGEQTLPKVSLPNEQIDLGTLIQGTIQTLQIPVANTGTTDLWFWADTGSPYALRANTTIEKLGPGGYAVLDLTLDTINFPIGIFSETLTIRTNSPDHSTFAVQMSGNIQSVSNGIVAQSPNLRRPLEETVTIVGTNEENTMLVTQSDLTLHEETKPLYFVAEDDTVAGKGDAALELGEPPIRVYETTANIIAPFPDSDARPEASQVILGAFSNPSFETGTRYPWAFLPYNDSCNWAIYNWPTVAFHGDWLLATNMNDNPDCSGFYQEDDTQPMAIGDTYRFAFWVRSSSSSPRSGSLSLWGLGGTTEVQQMGFEVGPTWTCVETSLTVQKSGHTRMRTEVYLRSYDHTNYYFDNASFTRNGGPICPKPATPTLNNISNSDGDGSYTVTWNASTYALTYQLQERYENGSWSTVYDGSGTSQSRSGRTPGTWCYQVRATNNAGSSNWSAIKCTTVKPASAPVLSDISNADGDGNYTVTWSGVTGATSYLLQEQHDGGSWVSIYTGSSTSQNLTGRTSGTWCYQVQASNASGSGPWSVTKCTTVNILPNLPTGLLPANNAGWLGHAPVLEWQDGGDPDNAPNPYRLFRVNVASLTWDTITAWSQDQNWHESVPADDIYTWRTQAYDGLATSGWTPVQTLRVYSIEKSGANEISLALPEDVFDFVRYKVQYAVEATITDSLTPSVTRITLPKRTYDAASLTLILAEAMGTSVTFSIDAGNDGLNVWSDTISWDGVTPIWVDSPDLAVALNSYLATLGVNGGAMVDVPIAISLDTEGVVYLTNVFLTPGIDSDPAVSAGNISLSDPSPTETSLVTVTATIDNLGDYEARNIMATLVVSDSIVGPSIVGNDFIPMIVSGGAAQADIVWDTTGYSGDVNLSVILDIAEQLVELDENNNTTTITVPVRSRPDIQADSWDLFNSEPVVGEAVTITVNLLNGGQTTSGPAIYALYDGNPDNGGLLLDTQIQSGLGANESDSITLSWTPTMPGPYRLFLRLDENGAINEFDEANNLLWQDVYVGLAGPIYLDSGVTASDPVYSSTLGYGYIDIGAPDVLLSCGGGNPEDTSRLDPDGSVNYRFNHLLPGHFYHLDVTLYECDGAGRQETVLVNGHQVAGPIDLGDGQIHRLSLLLDPALYSGHTIRVEIEAEGIDGALVNEVNLYDVDYRYSDAGGTRDPQYPGGALVNLGYPYGWFNGVANTAWGTLPSRSVRVNQTGNLLEYRFDGLKPEKRYNIHLVFWQPSGTARLQRIQLDGLDTGLTVNTGDFQMHQETIAVPPTAYTADGSVVVGVLRTNAATGAMVNEIALEEETLPRSGWCNVRQTPYFTDVYGDVAILSQGAPAGTVIEARNPRGDTVGCFVVGTAGQYGFMRIYGEDTTATPAIPGMRAGELVAFHVNGAPAVATPQLYWQADYATHRVDLNAGSITGQSILFQAGWNLISFRLEPPVPTVRQVLDSIDGRYDHVLGEIGAYAPAVPDVFNTLKELHPGLGYYVRISGSTSASALIEGLTVPVTTPILLHQGWNWIGYLPEATLPITVALQSIEGQYQRVLSLDKTYDPALPGYSTLHSMEPGRGYLIYANGAVTLTYPAAGALLNIIPERSVASGCEQLSPTPKFTLLYGELLLGDQPAPAGSRVEVLTPRGDVAGCLVLDKPGVISFMQVYGEDTTAPTPIPGFRDGEELTFRVNGVSVETEALLWRDDWAPHTITLKVDRIQLYLPLVIRDGE